MNRFRYVCTAVTLLSSVILFLPYYAPYFSHQSLLIDLGCAVNIVVFVLWALFWKKWRDLAIVSLVTIGLIVIDGALFSYRLNNVCDPGDHIIGSEADAIETAKSRILQAHYGSYGFFDEKPGSIDYSHTDNCCAVIRSRNIYGVIVWRISLRGLTLGEMTTRDVSAYVALSNCGSVFKDESFITAEPIKVDSIWPKIK
jgi:hypothetical protein